MSRAHAINEGFAAAVSDFALLLAELAWRWSFGIAAIVLIVISAREVQQAVTISPTDEMLMSTMQPVLVAEAWAHILRDTWPLLARAAAILLPALTALWIAAATLGRAVTIRRLLEYFAARYGAPTPAVRARWGALVALHAFRAAVMLAVALGYIGSALLASRFVSMEEGGPPNINAALVVFVLVFTGVVVAGAALNWLLALAPIFVVRDGRGTWESLRDAVSLFRTRGPHLTAAATWNGFLRFAAAVIASIAGATPLLLAGHAPGWVPWTAVALITVLYFVVSDWLLLARLAAYVAVAEQVRTPEEATVISG